MLVTSSAEQTVSQRRELSEYWNFHFIAMVHVKKCLKMDNEEYDLSDYSVPETQPIIFALPARL
jgi:hypothetical protein